MIVVTRLNGSSFAVNPDLIERVHANPDTTLVMVDGASYVVTESVSEIIERIAAYRAHVISLAHGLPTDGVALPSSRLGLVTALETDDSDDAAQNPGT